MIDDTSPEGSCMIELIYSVEARAEIAGQPPPISIGDTLAKIQAVIERAIAEESRKDPLLVSAYVRFRRAGSSPTSRRRRGSPSNSKKEIILDLLGSKEGATTKALQEATGWKPSTISAQLDYLSKTGHSINRSRVDGVLRYKLA